MEESRWGRLRRQSEAASDVDPNAAWRKLARQEPPPDPSCCPEATGFEFKLTEIMFRPLGNEPSKGQIAQAKYLLQEQWHLFKKKLPDNHARDQGQLIMHRCLDEVYHESYERLDLLEVTLRPTAEIIADYEEIVRSSRQEVKQTIEGIEIADDLTDG